MISTAIGIAAVGLLTLGFSLPASPRRSTNMCILLLVAVIAFK